MHAILERGGGLLWPLLQPFVSARFSASANHLLDRPYPLFFFNEPRATEHAARSRAACNSQIPLLSCGELKSCLQSSQNHLQVYHEMCEQLGLGNVYSREGAAEEGDKDAGQQQQQQALGANWLMFELLWRDFYRWVKSFPCVYNLS